MTKSVLGNDPFQTAAQPAQKPKKSSKSDKSKDFGKKKKTVKKTKKADEGKKTVSKKKAAPKKKAVAKKKITPAKKTVAKKKVKKPSAVKPAKTAPKPAKKAIKAKVIGGKTAAKIEIVEKKKTEISKSAMTPSLAEKSTPLKRTAVKAKLPTPKRNQARKAETKTIPASHSRGISAGTDPTSPGPELNRGASMAIGGDVKHLPLFRPDSFEAGQEYGFDPEFREQISPIIQFLYRFYWRVSVKGVENIPKEGRAVLVGNHAGILPFDGLVLNQAVKRETQRMAWPLIEDFFYYAPILGSLLSRAGCIRACQENAQRLLAEGELVTVFPEGIKGIVKPYRRRYRLQRFGRGGFVKLCLLTDSPAIPVAIVGSEESHPVLTNLNSVAKMLNLPYFPVTPLFPVLGPLGLMPLPAKWTVIIGEPIYVNQFGPEAARDRVAVNRLSNQVKSKIQKMIDMEIGQRKSRWH